MENTKWTFDDGTTQHEVMLPHRHQPKRVVDDVGPLNRLISNLLRAENNPDSEFESVALESPDFRDFNDRGLLDEFLERGVDFRESFRLAKHKQSQLPEVTYGSSSDIRFARKMIARKKRRTNLTEQTNWQEGGRDAE